MIMLESCFSKNIKVLLLAAVILMAPSQAHAGQGFFFSFDTSALSGAVTVNDVDYMNWNPRGINNNVVIASGVQIYTEHCAAAFGCGGQDGDQSLANDGIVFNLYNNGAVAFQICLSYSGPINSTTSCATGTNPKTVYDGWLAGCYAPNGGYSCLVTESQQGDQIAVAFVLKPAATAAIGTEAAPQGRAQLVAGGDKGTFMVSKDGAATYSLPLVVPPGTAGVEPSLSLIYNSQQGDGLLGVGWSLSGLSAIGRCTATPAIDGFAGSVNYDPNDRFCLDGKRLVGTISPTGPDFRIVIDSYSKIVASGQCGAGPCSFAVYDRNGSVSEFGTTRDSAIPATHRSDNAVSVWALARFTDANGNSMAFRYDVSQVSSAGAYYPAEISYTANSSTKPQLLAGRKVAFGYGVRSDQMPLYRAGSLFEWTRLLTTVTTSVAGQAARIYRLSYSTGQTTGLSRLTSIEDCDGAGNCFPPITLAHADDGAGPGVLAVQPPVSIAAFDPQAQYLAGDFNGDGRIDFAVLSNSANQAVMTFYYLTATGLTSYRPAEVLGSWQSGGTLLVGDFNGDGIQDVAQIYNQGNRIGERGYLSSGSAFALAKWTQPELGWPSGGMFATGDFNGDGLVDISIIADSGGRVSIASLLSTGSDFTLSSWQGLPQLWQGGYFLPSSYTSDGKTAIAYARPTGGYLAIDVIEYNDGDPVSSSWLPASAKVPWPTSPRLLSGDFNGDGTKDIAMAYDDSGGISIVGFLSTGTALVPSTLAKRMLANISQPQFFASDLNGDPMTDLVVLANSSGAISAVPLLARPTATGLALQQAPWPIDKSTSYMGSNFLIGDFAGFGYGDVLRLGKVGNELQASVYRLFPYSPSGNGPPVAPDAVVRMTDGMNADISIGYAPLTNASSSVYSKGSGAVYPIQDIQNSTYVVGNYTISNGLGQSYARTISYKGARVDITNWGWLGFNEVEVTNRQTGLVERRRYSQEFPMIGVLTSQQSLAPGSGAALQSTEYQFRCFTSIQTLNSLAPDCIRSSGVSSSGQPQFFAGVFQVLERRSMSFTFSEGSSAPASITRRSHTYDGYGNVVTTMDTAEAGSQSDTIHFCNILRNDDISRWQLGLVTATKATTNPTPCSTLTVWDPMYDLSWSRYEFDVKGNPAYSQDWVADSDASEQVSGCATTPMAGGRWLCTRFGVDEYGNVVTVVNARGNRFTTTYDNTYATFPIALTPPEPSPGVSLATHLSFDPLTGALKSYTDPNGTALFADLDGFGRSVAIYGPAPAGGTKTLLATRSYSFASTGGFVVTNRWCSNWAECAAATPANWFAAKELFDGLGRLIQSAEVMPAEDGTSGTCAATKETTLLTDYYYDDAGRPRGRSVPYIPGSSPIAYKLSYDLYQRPMQVTSPDSIVTEWSYDLDGRSNTAITASRSASGAPTSMVQKTVTTVDPRGRPISVVGPDAGVTTYQYSATGRMTRMTDPIGVVTTYGWNSLGQLTSIGHPDTGTTLYAYDAVGNLTSVTNQLGQTVSFRYDAVDRPTAKTVAEAGQQVRLVTYSYDEASFNGIPVPFGRGRLTGISESTGAYALGYNRYGRLATLVSRPSALSQNFSFAWSYGPRGNTESFIYPDDAVLTYGYRSDLALCAVRLTPQGEVAQTYATYSRFTALKQPQDVSYLNGVITSYTYDGIGRPLSQKTLSASSTPLVDVSYAWGSETSAPVNVLTDIFDNAAGGQGQSFGYDEMGRLLNASGPYGSTQLTYNKGGAITSQDGHSYTYPSSPSYRPRTIESEAGGRSSTEATFSFDVVGNMTAQVQIAPDLQAPSLLLEFDPEHRLQSITRSTDQAPTSHTYGPFDRLSKTDPDGTVTWYPGPNYVLTVLSDGSMVATKTIPGPIGPVAEISNTVSGSIPTERIQ